MVFENVNTLMDGERINDTRGLFACVGISALVVDYIILRNSWYQTSEVDPLLIYLYGDSQTVDFADVKISHCLLENNTMVSTWVENWDDDMWPSFFFAASSQTNFSFSHNVFQVRHSFLLTLNITTQGNSLFTVSDISTLGFTSRNPESL